MMILKFKFKESNRKFITKTTKKHGVCLIVYINNELNSYII